MLLPDAISVGGPPNRVGCEVVVDVGAATIWPGGSEEDLGAGTTLGWTTVGTDAGPGAGEGAGAGTGAGFGFGGSVDANALIEGSSSAKSRAAAKSNPTPEKRSSGMRDSAFGDSVRASSTNGSAGSSPSDPSATGPILGAGSRAFRVLALVLYAGVGAAGAAGPARRRIVGNRPIMHQGRSVVATRRGRWWWEESRNQELDSPPLLLDQWRVRERGRERHQYQQKPQAFRNCPRA